MRVNGARTLLAPMVKMAENILRITEGPLKPQPFYCFLEGHISKLGLFTQVHSGLRAGNGSFFCLGDPIGVRKACSALLSSGSQVAHVRVSQPSVPIQRIPSSFCSDPFIQARSLCSQRLCILDSRREARRKQSPS